MEQTNARQPKQPIVVQQPQNDEEIEQLLHQLSDELREVTRIQDEAAAEVAATNARMVEEVEPHKEIIDALQEVLFPVLESRWGELAERHGTEATLKFAQSVVKKHIDTKGSLVVFDLQGAIKAIKALGGNEFIETKESIKVDSIKKWPLLPRIRRYAAVIYKNTISITFPETPEDKRLGRKLPKLTRETS